MKLIRWTWPSYRLAWGSGRSTSSFHQRSSLHQSCQIHHSSSGQRKSWPAVFQQRIRTHLRRPEEKKKKWSIKINNLHSLRPWFLFAFYSAPLIFLSLVSSTCSSRDVFSLTQPGSCTLRLSKKQKNEKWKNISKIFTKPAKAWVIKARNEMTITWWALQIRSMSCFIKNSDTLSGPKVNETPLSFNPQPFTSLPGSDQSKSQSRPESGTSVGRGRFLIWSKSVRSGDKPPCMHRILSSISAATGKQLKQSVNVFHSLTLNRRLHSS